MKQRSGVIVTPFLSSKVSGQQAVRNNLLLMINNIYEVMQIIFLK